MERKLMSYIAEDNIKTIKALIKKLFLSPCISTFYNLTSWFWWMFIFSVNIKTCDYCIKENIF